MISVNPPGVFVPEKLEEDTRKEVEGKEEPRVKRGFSTLSLVLREGTSSSIVDLEERGYRSVF